MKKVHNKKDLDQRVSDLHILQEKQKEEIRADFRGIAQSLNPANIIRDSLQSVLATPGLAGNAVDTAVSSGAGYIGKKMVIKKSHNFFRHLAGVVVELVVTNFVRNKFPLFRGKAARSANGVK